MRKKKVCSKTPKKQRGKPFARGDVRINRQGRPPKDLSITEALRTVGQAADAEKIQALAEYLWREALGGNLAAAKMLCDRIEGLPGQRIDMHDSTPAIVIGLPPGIDPNDL